MVRYLACYKNLTLDIISALLEVDKLNAWLLQKQSGLRLLVKLKKLYHLIGPIHSKMSTLVEKLKNANIEAKDNQAGSQKPKRSRPKSKLRGLRSRDQDLIKKLNRWENPIVFLIAFSLPMNILLCLAL